MQVSRHVTYIVNLYTVKINMIYIINKIGAILLMKLNKLELSNS